MSDKTTITIDEIVKDLNDKSIIRDGDTDNEVKVGAINTKTESKDGKVIIKGDS